MALEQVVPVVPQGTFSVTTRKASWELPFPPQWSCGDKAAHSPSRAEAQQAAVGGAAGPPGGWGAAVTTPGPACTRSPR